MAVKTEINSEPSAVGAADPGYRLEETGDGNMGLIDLLLILADRKKLIAGVTLAGGLTAALIAFWLPNTYTATAIILPPQQAQTAVSALVGQLGPLAAVAGSNLGLKSPGDLYVGLLGSRTIADCLIERFRLRELYRAKTMVDARNKLRSRSRFSAGKDSLIKLEVDDPEPKRAAAIANAYFSELNIQNTSYGTTEARDRRLFLEKQLDEERTALSTAEDEMKRTQVQTGIIHVEAQTSVAIASAAQLRAMITAGEVSLQQLNIGATGENPEVRRVEVELDALQAQLKKLEEAPRGGGDPLVATSAIPAAGLAYMRRLRDLKYHEFLFEMLSKQYEAARIDESKVAPALQLVDAAVPPDKKSGPHRELIVLFGLLAAAASGSVIAYARHNNGNPPTAEKLRALRSQFSIRGSGSGRLPAPPRRSE